MPASFREEMASYYKNQSIPFRAVTLYHQNKWNKLKSGDLALLYRVGVYYASARIAFKIHSHGLARAIFPLEDENKMDELFCFFECPVTPIYLPKEHIRPAVLRGFTVIDGATNQTEVNGYERAAKRAAINES